MEIAIDDNTLARLLQAINETYGYDFNDYSMPSVKRRVGHFMSLKKIDSVNDLQTRLLNDPMLFEEFVQGMSVTVTEMFRDPEFFRTLRSVVMKRLSTYPVIKIWIAGCATGEEAYSVAILFQEEGLLERCRIYATDINQRSIEIARSGVYPLGNLKQYGSNYLQSGGIHQLSRYFHLGYGGAIIEKTLRECVHFSVHNLAADASFNEFQLILCRNVIMYFNNTLQNKVVKLFYESLCPYGFIGLGDKESLMFLGENNSFHRMDSRQKIYMRI